MLKFTPLDVGKAVHEYLVWMDVVTNVKALHVGHPFWLVLCPCCCYIIHQGADTLGFGAKRVFFEQKKKLWAISHVTF